MRADDDRSRQVIDDGGINGHNCGWRVEGWL
jgi:hypothetical protein